MIWLHLVDTFGLCQKAEMSNAGLEMGKMWEYLREFIPGFYLYQRTFRRKE